MLQHQGYRYHFASLAPALERHVGDGWRNVLTPPESDAARIRLEQRLGRLLLITRRSPGFQHYHQAITDRVHQALTERARRLT